MKLTSKHDIEAPLEQAYARLTDFDQFERMALRRGAEVERLDRMKAPAPGMGWRLHFVFKGKPRKITVKLVDLSPSGLIDYGLDSPLAAGGARIELESLGAKRCRMTVTLDLRPRTLSARIFVQTLKLARGRVQRRFDAATAKLANLVEDQTSAV